LFHIFFEDKISLFYVLPTLFYKEPKKTKHLKKTKLKRLTFCNFKTKHFNFLQ